MIRSVSPEEQYDEFCKARGFKNTAQRRAIVHEIFERFKRGESFTADNLKAALAAKGLSVSLATVYRTLLNVEMAELVDRHDKIYTVR